MNGTHNQIVIALGADNKYLSQVLTTIKSISVYNSNVKFYLLNRDIPTEFFEKLNGYLVHFNSCIIDLKISNNEIKKYPTYSYINSDSTFFRYFISALIPEEKVLYLDSDLVVNGSLDKLFETDLNHYFLAAVEDIICKKIHHRENEFNAGVMLINNRLWKAHNITNTLIQISEKCSHAVPDADQSILNLVFKDRWLKLNRGYNYLVGLGYLYQKFNLKNELEDLNGNTPLIIHYNTEAKPWLNGYNIMFRELYWYYTFLDWQEIYHLRQSNG